MSEFDRALLQELLVACGPSGQEEAVRDICRRELEPLADECWIDPAGNLVGLVRGADPDAPGVRVMAHLDELSMLVKRIEPDGSLSITPLGTMYPANFGLGPVHVLGENACLTGVLSLGSEHTTQESPRIWQSKPDQDGKALNWPQVYVFTGRSPAELAEAGVRPGTRVCVDPSRRTLVEFGDYLGCYFMDDRAAITAVLHALHLLRDREARPAGEVYLVFTTAEEVGGIGASYANSVLPGEVTLALDVGPTEQEYGTKVGDGPIVAYADAQCIYDKQVADTLVRCAAKIGLAVQTAVLGAFESDASHAKSNGLTARAGLLCLPTLNTHGYEVVHRHTVPATAHLLAEYLMNP